MSVARKVVATVVVSSIFGLVAMAGAQPPECQEAEPRAYDPIDLEIGNGGLTTGCEAVETACEISAVLETDGVFIAHRPERTITTTFQVDPSTPSHLSIEIASWASSANMPPELVSLRNWESGAFEKRAVATGALSSQFEGGAGLVLTIAYVTCEEAPSYVDPTGRVDVRVERNSTPPQGDSDRWVDEVDIVIPPP